MVDDNKGGGRYELWAGIVRQLRTVKLVKDAKARDEDRPMTQEDLATALGVDRGTVSKIEAEDKAAETTLKKLAQVFETSASFLSPEWASKHPDERRDPPAYVDILVVPRQEHHVSRVHPFGRWPVPTPVASVRRDASLAAVEASAAGDDAPSLPPGSPVSTLPPPERLPEERSPAVDVPPRAMAPLRVYGFRARAKAVEDLLAWRGDQPTGQLRHSRIIAYTADTLRETIGDLLFPANTTLDCYLGTRQTARQMLSTRQAGLLKNFWSYESADWGRWLVTPTTPSVPGEQPRQRLCFRYHIAPPSFTGISIGDSAYLINVRAWVPTLRWMLNTGSKWADRFQEELREWPGRLMTEKDEYTLTGADLPSIVVTCAPGATPTPEFLIFQRLFEAVWRRLEADWHRIGVESEKDTRWMKGIQQMLDKQEKAVERIRREIAATEDGAVPAQDPQQVPAP